MTHSRTNSRDSLLLRELRAAAILSIPFYLFLVPFCLLLLQYGGHRFAHLGVNPYCRLPIPQDGSIGAKSPVTVLLQISDLHVNDNDGGRAKKNLRAFQTKVLPRWAPFASAILVSGDLVNGASHHRYPFGGRSMQHASEWGFLDEFVTEVNKSVPWIAAYGNHDTFGGPVHSNPHAPICAAPGQAVEKTVLRSSDGQDVSVFALDCTLPTPLHRPLNFFGDGRRAASQLAESLAEMDSDGNAKMSVAFGHYPTSIMAGGRGVHHAAKRTDEVGGLQKPRLAAFLSGHLHTLKGFVPAGLQAVSQEGVLELQLPDMWATGAFRVLTLDGGSLSFKDFSVHSSGSVGLDDILVTNLPRAGFCSAGAGKVALQSAHVRLVGPEMVMEGRKLEVRIDDVSYGSVTRISSVCEKEETAWSESNRHVRCVPLYGVPWNASHYDDGKLHTLTIHSNGEQSAPFAFSLNGTPEAGVKSRLRRLVSALFSLSDFATMSSILCSLGFFFCFVFCIPGLFRRSATTFAVCSIALLLKFGPAFIIANQLTDADTGIGMAGLRYVRLPDSIHQAGTDLPYMVSVTVLFGSLVPVSFFDAVTSSRAASALRQAVITRVFATMYVLKSLSWCLEIFGAHGVLAVFVSPSCIPLFVAVVLSILGSFRSLQKKRE